MLNSALDKRFSVTAQGDNKPLTTLASEQHKNRRIDIIFKRL